MSAKENRDGNERKSEKQEPMWRRYMRFYGADTTADIDDELRDHLESTRDVLISQGMTVPEATAEATRRLGDTTRVRREVEQLDQHHQRRSRWSASLEAFVQDARFATRAFVRTPAFTVVATLSIALGVAVNSTVFSAVNAVLFRPIPGANSDGLVRVYSNHHSPFSWHDLSWLRDHTQTLDRMVGERNGVMSFRNTNGERVERVRTSLVTRGFFPALGVRMQLGRAFDVDEQSAESGQPVAVLSYQFWQREFAGDLNVIGRKVSIADHPVIISGVASPEFRSSVVGWSPEVFLPLAVGELLTGVKLEDFGGSLYTTAKLKDGVSKDKAGAELTLLMSQLARTDSARYERTTVRLDHVRGVNAELRTATAAGSAFLMTMVAFVLLIACANVANLLLGRAASRHTEIGVRLALGASRSRIVRQLLTESLLLAIAGTAIGLAVTYLLTRSMTAAIPADAGIDQTFFVPDHRVLLFTGTLCLATTLLFGLVPALRAASPHLVPMMKADVQPSKRRGKRGGLMAVQTALCVLLLAVASLFYRSLQSMSGLDSGFRAANVVDVELNLTLTPGNNATRQATFARVLQRVRAIPGIQSATLAALVPLAGSNMETRIVPEGSKATSRFEYPSTYFNIIAPKYFETLSIPLRTGRGFQDDDRETTTRVAVINETAAQRWWPNQRALGKHFHWGSADGADVEVVGIANDADYNMPGESRKSFVYMPLSQEPRGEMVLQVKTTLTLNAAREAVWGIVRSEVPLLPPPPVTNMNDDMSITLFPVKTGAALLATLGLIALSLAAVGIYGVTAYAVAQRTREIGIRAALGADRLRLLRMVLRDALKPISTGLVIGLTLAVLAAVGLSRVLYGIHAIDPVVLPGVAAILVVVSLLASLVPARRAASVDPVIAIRNE